MPSNTVKVDRTTRWGNPYKEGVTPGNYASWFRADLAREMASPAPTEDHPISRHLHAIGQNVHILRGMNLGCWCRLCDAHKAGKPFGVECPDCAPCHSDPLGILANSPPRADP